MDDDPETAVLVKTALDPEGYVTELALGGQQALRLIPEYEPDLILLDVRMPGMTGPETLAEIRKSWRTPVMMLSAFGDEGLIVTCLEGGADDYLQKSFGLRELRARVRALLRRSGASGPEPDDVIVLDHGAIVINLATSHMVVRGEPVCLGPLEYKLLLVLVENEGRVLTKEYLLRAVWGPGYEGASDCLKMCVGRLRAKIEVDPARPRYIHARWGVGYYWQSP